MEELLKRLAGIVQDSKKEVKDDKLDWLKGLLTSLVVILVVAAFAYSAWKAGKERAKLLHQRDVEKEKAHQALIDAELAESEQRYEELLDARRHIIGQIALIELKVEELTKDYNEARSKLNSITDWSDLGIHDERSGDVSGS